MFHGFFTRATWRLDVIGRVVFRLALAWIPAEQPLYVLIDDPLARRCTGAAQAEIRADIRDISYPPSAFLRLPWGVPQPLVHGAQMHRHCTGHGAG
jgi:hypothetical protein